MAPIASEPGGVALASTRLIAGVGLAAEFLAVMGNEKRLVIMTYLVDHELSVGTIAKMVSLSQSALSQHLAKLRAVGLVQTRRERQTIYYSCSCAAVSDLLNVLRSIYGERPRGKADGNAASPTEHRVQLECEKTNK